MANDKELGDSPGPLTTGAISVMGEPTTFSPAALARIAEDAAVDRQISELAKAGVSYPEMATIIGISLPSLMKRIGMLLTTNQEILSSQMMNDHLLNELRIISLVVASGLEDMEVQADGKVVSESVAGKIRHNGRLAVIKALQQEALIMGLVRQRVDIRKTEKVAISVVSQEEWDAL